MGCSTDKCSVPGAHFYCPASCAERNHLQYLILTIKYLLLWITQLQHFHSTISHAAALTSATTVIEGLKKFWPNLCLPSIVSPAAPTTPPPDPSPPYNPSEQALLPDENPLPSDPTPASPSSPSLSDITYSPTPSPARPAPSGDTAMADAQPNAVAVEVDPDLAKFAAAPYTKKWDPARHKLPQFKLPSLADAASSVLAVATLFFAELLAALEGFHIEFAPQCWSYCFEHVRSFKQVLFVSIRPKNLNPAKVLTLFKQHYLTQVRSPADAARDKLHEGRIRMGRGPGALRKYETAFREQLRFCPNMPPEDVIRFFKKGLTTDLQIACQMDHTGRPFQDLASLLTFAYGLERVMMATEAARRVSQNTGTSSRFRSNGPQANHASAFHPAAPSLSFRKGGGLSGGCGLGSGAGAGPSSAPAHGNNGNRQRMQFGGAVQNRPPPQQQQQQRGFNNRGPPASSSGPSRAPQYSGSKRPLPPSGGHAGGARAAVGAAISAAVQPHSGSTRYWSDVYQRHLTDAEFAALTANGPICLGCHAQGVTRKTCTSVACQSKRQRA